MSKIKIKTKKEIELIRSAGALAAETLVRAAEMWKPGGNTLEIDEFIGDFTKKHGGISETFTVRRISYGVGVERTFPVNSPKIAKIEVVRSGKVRRAKLYYIRERVGKAAKVKEKIK